MLPKPAKGTPRRNHEIVKPINDNPEINDISTPKIETHAKGREL
jgi:hypothetical protein